MIPRRPLAVLTLALLPGLAWAQAGLGPRGFDTGRADIAPPRPAAPRTEVPAAPARTAAAPDLPDVPIRDVAVIGDTLLGREALREAVAPFAGRRLTLEELRALADAVAAAHRRDGFALFAVTIPQQDLANGVVVVRVIEGRITNVEITGDTEGADLSLTRAYAERLRAERPLRQSTLERYILLMGDTPGRRITSSFVPTDTPGEVTLRLEVARTSLRYGLGLDNLGASYLGDVQVTTGVTLNSLLREGDQTRLTVGLPIGAQRFTYVALRHQQPIGTDGLTVALTGSILDIRPTDRSVLEGQTTTFGVQVSYPVIRATHRTLQVFAGLDVLSARNEVPLGRLTDEETRVIRAGVAYGQANEAGTRVGTLALVLNQGLAGLGARQGLGFFFGDPEFTKLTAVATFRQEIWERRFNFRLRGTLQYTNERLPATEAFAYGGVDYGRAFNAATIAGDRGGSVLAMLAMPLRTVWDVDGPADRLGRIGGRMLRGAEAYVFADAARVENRRPGLPRSDRAASIGGGFAFPVAEETTLNLEVTSPLVRPRGPFEDQGTRFVAVFRRNF